MTDSDLESPLVPLVPGDVWLKRYPVRFAAMDISARLTLLRLRDGSLVAHSPCPIDAALRAEVEAVGPLKHIVAPGTYHYFHVATGCSGIEARRCGRAKSIRCWCAERASSRRSPSSTEPRKRSYSRI